MGSTSEPWWKAEKNEAHNRILDHVRLIERDQFDLFDRFVKLAALYDPNEDGNASPTDLVAFSLDFRALASTAESRSKVSAETSPALLNTCARAPAKRSPAV
jgi:hypothetical protein